MSNFEDLLKECKRQDSQALLKLYNICCRPVYNACLHIVLNEFDAEEIMQDSILKAFGLLDKFLGTKKDFIAFVKKIAVNKSIDWYRKHSKDPFFKEIENETDTIAEDVEEEAYPIDKIIEKMELLPNGYKMVMKLHLLDEMDFVDIAEMMNVKASTVRSQYVRALDKLRKSISLEYEYREFNKKQ